MMMRYLGAALTGIVAFASSVVGLWDYWESRQEGPTTAAWAAKWAQWQLAQELLTQELAQHLALPHCQIPREALMTAIAVQEQSLKAFPSDWVVHDTARQAAQNRAQQTLIQARQQLAQQKSTPPHADQSAVIALSSSSMVAVRGQDRPSTTGSGIAIAWQETFPIRDRNPAQASQREAVLTTVGIWLDQLCARGVPWERLHVIAKAALNTPTVGQPLQTAIDHQFGRPLVFIDDTQEAALIFWATVPADVRAQTIIFDIGSRGTYGAYAEQITPLRLVTFSLPWGTKTISPDSLATAANDLESVLATHPGLTYLPKVYLSGGISWAMTLTTTYETQGRLTRLTSDHWARFCAATPTQATENPPPTTLSEIDRLRRNVFTSQQLAAGTQLLCAWGTQLELIRGQRESFFNWRALDGWLLGYLAMVANQTQPAP